MSVQGSPRRSERVRVGSRARARRSGRDLDSAADGPVPVLEHEDPGDALLTRPHRERERRRWPAAGLRAVRHLDERQAGGSRSTALLFELLITADGPAASRPTVTTDVDEDEVARLDVGRPTVLDVSGLIREGERPRRRVGRDRREAG